MKKILIFIVLMTLADLAYAQASAHQRTIRATINNQASGQTGGIGTTANAPNGITNMPQRTGSTGLGIGQQGNTTTSPQANNNSHGLEICRKVGSKVFYCD